VLQNGRSIHAAVEARSPTGHHLVAQDAVKEDWRYQDLKADRLVPELISHDDRLYVFDDASLHLLEQDGTRVRTFSLPAQRMGPVVELPPPSAGRRDLVVPTATNLLRLRFGTHQDPVSLIADPVLAAIGTGQLGVEADALAVVNGAKLNVVRCGAPSKALWHAELPQPAVFRPTMDATWVAVADGRGLISILRRSDGTVVDRILHGSPLAGPVALVVRDGAPIAVCADKLGQVVAYRIAVAP
jgi:hypothetical protein